MKEGTACNGHACHWPCQAVAFCLHRDDSKLGWKPATAYGQPQIMAHRQDHSLLGLLGSDKCVRWATSSMRSCLEHAYLWRSAHATSRKRRAGTAAVLPVPRASGTGTETSGEHVVCRVPMLHSHGSADQLPRVPTTDAPTTYLYMYARDTVIV